MIATPDAGEIKARVTIEYDGSGIDQAKQDLASLADIVGGGLAESTGSANDALSSLDEQMGKSADSTTALVSSVSSLAKPLQASSDGFTSVVEAMGEQQSAIEDTGSAFESLQKPIEGTTVLLEEASPPMLAITQHAESMQAQMSGVNDGFVQIGESLSQSVPLLPAYAASLHTVSEEFDHSQLADFNENFNVFQDALNNPYPFQMIQQHLVETGQTWDDFSSSIGDSNAAYLDQMIAMPVASEKAFTSISSDVGDVGQSFHALSADTAEFSQPWSVLIDSITGINKQGGVGTALYGPSESWAKLDDALSSTQEGINKLGGVGEVAYGPEVPTEAPIDFSGLGTGFGNIVQGFDSFMKPIMYAQMAGMMIGQVSTGIYNMAALAEGPAAHSVGTFTGAIDVMSQHSQAAAEQFSEGFGKGVLPMLNAINNVTGNGSGNDFWSMLGGGIGSGLSLLGNLGQIVGGGLVDAGSFGFTLNPNNPVGNNWLQSGWEGLQNMWADWSGNPQPYPTPGSGSGSTQVIDLSTIQTQLATSVATMNAQANSPAYLGAQAYLQSQSGYATLGQASYNASHSTGMTPFDYAPQSYQNSMMAQALANGDYSDPYSHASTNDSGYGISMADLNKAYFDNMAAKLPPLPPFELEGGCFPAGTPVLLADGTEKAIETLQVGEQVKAHDGIKQVATTILACIKPHPRCVYTLFFDDDNTLTLTDSHPIMTHAGWKSLSPANAKRENPGLAVMALQIGDCIHTLNGTCTLLAIEPREIVPIYNITVGEPHTFYASGVLVHNKVYSSQIMQNVADTTVPSMDMKNSNLIQSLASNFSSADLTHTFTATVSWTANNLDHGFTGIASWVGQGLSNTFNGIANWVGQGLSNTFNGVANWVGRGLSNTFNGIASWVGQGLTNAFTGIASWIGQGLTNTFSGVADWVGQNLTHTFTGIANWVEQEVTQVVGSIPGFASGVEGFGGGLAVVGEQGPELVYLPKNSSVYPQSSGGGFLPLSTGDNSGPMNITINHTTTLDGKVVAQETIPYIAPIVRSQFGVRR